MMISSLQKNSQVLDYNTKVLKIENESDSNQQEETVDDVIYLIKYKKETVPLTSPHSTNAVVATKVHTIQLRHLTFEHLVSRLCSAYDDDDDDDDTFIKCSEKKTTFATIMLETFRSYATPQQLLQAIIKEHQVINSSPTNSDARKYKLNRSLEEAIHQWLAKYFDCDFNMKKKHENALSEILLRFANNRIKEVPEDEEGRDLEVEMRLKFLNFVIEKMNKTNKEEIIEANQLERIDARFLDIHDELQDIHLDGDGNYIACKQMIQGDEIHPMFIAEQLTIVDAKLFLQIPPHMFLEIVSSPEKPSLIQATIDQFNKVVHAVEATCLCSRLTSRQRKIVLCKWIQVASYCRDKKNFTSMHAVKSALTTTSLVRLYKLWSSVPDVYRNLFEELKTTNVKSLILKTGTTQEMDRTSRLLKKEGVKRRIMTNNDQILYGTIPYLGSVFHDIIYLSEALKKRVGKNNDKINFSKCRKEFDILAQLHLWQATCKRYKKINNSPMFFSWIESIVKISDDEKYKLSNKIEPQVNNSNTEPQQKSTNNESRSFSLTTGILTTSDVLINSLDTNGSTEPVESNKSTSPSFLDEKKISQEGRKRIMVRLLNSEQSANSEVVKEQLYTLDPNHRTTTVIKQLLEVFELKIDEVSKYSLYQILSAEKVFKIPDGANVYYAMNWKSNDSLVVLLENGIELKKFSNLIKQSTPTPYANDKKSHSRGFSSSSLLETIAKSPIRSIVNHITTLSSGSYDLTSQTKESSHRRVSSDVSLLQLSSNCRIASNEETDSSSIKGLSKKMKDLVYYPNKKKLSKNDLNNLDNTSLSPSGSKTLPRLRNKDNSWRMKYSPKFLRKLHHSVSDYDVVLDDCEESNFEKNILKQTKVGSKDIRKKTKLHDSNWKSDPCLLENDDSFDKKTKIPAIVIERTSIVKKSSKNKKVDLIVKRHSSLETSF